MKKNLWIMGSFMIVVGLMVYFSEESQAGKKHAYVGVKKCSKCHKKEKDGEQYPLWKKSAHAGAYKTLASKKAKEIAAKKGIKDPQKSDKCLKCHVTGHGDGDLAKAIDKKNGVGCESCHGGGKDYYKKSTMKDQKKALAKGLHLPTAKTCAGCHNAESPTYKGPDPAKDMAGFTKEIKKHWDKIKHYKKGNKPSKDWK